MELFLLNKMKNVKDSLIVNGYQLARLFTVRNFFDLIVYI